LRVSAKNRSLAVEAVLLLSDSNDSETLRFDGAFWAAMVERSRYAMGQKAGRSLLSAITGR
jgi:hypothetical protein